MKSYLAMFDTKTDESWRLLYKSFIINKMDSGDPSIDTIVPIGVMGAGKSSLCNIIALQDGVTQIPNRD